MQAWESYSTARVQHDSRGGDVVPSEGSCHSRAHEGVVPHEHRTLRDGQRRDDGEGGQHHHDGEQHAQEVRQLARHEEVVAPRLHNTANSRALAVMLSTIARASLASGVGEELRFPSRRGHRAEGHSRRARSTERGGAHKATIASGATSAAALGCGWDGAAAGPAAHLPRAVHLDSRVPARTMSLSLAHCHRVTTVRRGQVGGSNRSGAHTRIL